MTSYTPRINFTSYEEYKQLLQQALQKHLDAVPELLDFLWKFADFEISDLGHDNPWLYESGNWFMIMTKGQEEVWCQNLAAILRYTLQRVLFVVCEYNQQRVNSPNPMVLRSNKKAVRLVKSAVKSFFEEGPWIEDFFDTNFEFDADENFIPLQNVAHQQSICNNSSS